MDNSACSIGALPGGTHCECSRQSILYVLGTLLPGREIQVAAAYGSDGGKGVPLPRDSGGINMEPIEITKENLAREHICCAISNRKDP